jgi:hypothetical protein
LNLSLVGVKEVSICRENPFFVNDELFIKSYDKKVLIRYIGDDSEIVIGREVEIISTGCFYNCESFCEITFEFGSKLQRIETQAFYGTNLKMIHIPSSVECIGDECFEFSNSLCEITFGCESALREIGDHAFSVPSLKRINLPKKCEIISGLSLVGVKEVSLCPENPFFVQDQSFIKSYDRKVVIRYVGDDIQIVIVNEIERICAGCFNGYESRFVLEFESGSKLQRLEEFAFMMTHLEKIEIPSTVEFIGNRCFYGCNSLCEITFESGSKLQRIEEYGFPGTNLKMIQIPSSVELIGNSCFCQCKSLYEITFESESSLKEIGNNAFSGTNLKGIELPKKCEVISGLSLFGVKEISICRENPFFVHDELFIKSIDKKVLIRYIGYESSIVIGKEIRNIDNFKRMLQGM